MVLFASCFLLSITSHQVGELLRRGVTLLPDELFGLVLLMLVGLSETSCVLK